MAKSGSREETLDQFMACWEGLEDPRSGNAMQKEGSKGSTRGKFKRAGWDNAYLIRLLEMF